MNCTTTEGVNIFIPLLIVKKDKCLRSSFNLTESLFVSHKLTCVIYARAMEKENSHIASTKRNK